MSPAVFVVEPDLKRAAIGDLLAPRDPLHDIVANHTVDVVEREIAVAQQKTGVFREEDLLDIGRRGAADVEQARADVVAAEIEDLLTVALGALACEELDDPHAAIGLGSRGARDLRELGDDLRIVASRSQRNRGERQGERNRRAHQRQCFGRESLLTRPYPFRLPGKPPRGIQGGAEGRGTSSAETLVIWCAGMTGACRTKSWLAT